MILNPAKIKVRPGLDRFRKDHGDLTQLATSIKEKGQIQPILINEQYELIAGGRRLAACTLYNIPIECKVLDQKDSLKMRELEMEENVQRKDFTPAEHVLAVKELHELKQTLYTSQANNSITGTSWTMEDTANLLGKDRTSISKDLDLASMVEAFPSLASCKTKRELKDAGNALMKLLGRAEGLEEYKQKLQGMEQVQIYNIDALEFMQSLSDNSVDILLCDPPYGIEISENTLGKGGKTGEENNQGFTYLDTPEIAFEMISKIARESYRFCKNTAHAYIFCSPEYFINLYIYMRKAGWQPYIRPLIWNKPGNGQSNMPEYWPIANYEMCLYARRENSKLIYARPDILTYNRVQPNDKIHPTQKPVDLLRDIITRSVQPGAVLVDPCMGSGSSLVAGIKENLIVKGSDISIPAYTAALEYINKTLEE
jgi:site-specific DNA-methyltransferase (adenine-specific)